MLNPIRSIRASKAEYRRQAARAAALPEDHRFVYDKVLGYIWPFAGGAGLDMLQTQYDLLDLFEAGAAAGRPVLAVTGEDVAAFCDALIRDNTLWPDRLRRRLNRRVNKRLWGKAE